MIGNRREKGAVLVVALVMLGMVTFLVVAFVGFARFERASVTASMRRTEATFASQDAMSIASSQIINLMTNGIAFGLAVSERTNDVIQFVPVYMDTDGDGKQDRNSTYLNLNSETNRIPEALTPPFDDAVRFQNANSSANILGDPEWIGILRDSNRTHGPDNRFVARAAFMTVPLSRSLNVRYHHDVPLNTAAPTYVRSQGLKPGEINMAAPLYHIDPFLFDLPDYNSRYYADAFHGLGAGVVDAIHYSRPSAEFNRNLGRGLASPIGTPAGDLSRTSADAILNFQKWFSHPAHRNRPSRFYRFMETFSAAELPVEDDRFDVSTIRDQPIGGFAYTVDRGESDKIVFLEDHPFQSGDKVSVTSPVNPNIWDPIDWKQDPATLSVWQQLFASGDGSFNSVKPHKLIFGDNLEIQVPKINASGNTLRLIIFDVATGAWRPLTVVDQSQGILQYRAKSASANEELQETSISIQFTSRLDASKHYWGDKVGGVWMPKFKLNFDSLAGDPATDLPPEFQNQKLTVRYRNLLGNPRTLDSIPYYIEVISQKEVSLHRSPLLDDFSRVNFINPVGGTLAKVDTFYNASNNIFMNYSFVTPPSRYNALKLNTDRVRFTGAAMPVYASTGIPVTDKDVFIVASLTPSVVNSFQLRHYLLPAITVEFKDSGTYQLQRVHQFTCDKLTESVEKMAGAMLNESIDVEGPGAAAIVKVGAQSIPTPPSTTGGLDLRLGIGGHQQPLGPWHKPQSGIPWGRGTPTFGGQGSYSPEIERIIQVAANIGDLYSDYNGPNLKVGPREIVYGGSNVNGPVPHVLIFGEYSRDAHIQATITQKNKGPHGRPGLVLCYRTDLTEPYLQPYYRIRYTDYETSFVTPEGLTRPGYARIELMLHNETLLAKSGEFLELAVPFELKATCERGREVKVYLNGKLVIHHEHTEPLVGQVGLMAANGNWSFTNISPGFTPSSARQDGLAGPGAAWSWGLPHRTASPGNPIPTAYQGVFSRDKENNTYLAGFQRKTLFRANSWYQRGAPKVIGVKGRNGTAGYQNRMPALNEVSLRLAYDRNSNGLRGKLSTEVDVPIGYGSVYKIKISNLRLSGDRVATYESDPNPLIEPFNFRVDNANTILSKEGYVTYAFNSWLPISMPSMPPIARTKPGLGPVPSSLSDIQLQNLQLRMYVEISNKTTDRIVDFFEGVLSLPQAVSLANPVQDRLYAPVWNQTTAVSGGYPLRSLVLDPTNFDYYRMDSPTTAEPRPGASGWTPLRDNLKYRKIDVSWQVNDPLVNSSVRGWQSKVYAVKDFTDGPAPVRGNGINVIWSKDLHNEVGLKNINDFVYPANTGLSKFRLQARLGSNLSARNDKMLHWNAAGSPQDSAMQDPGVGVLPNGYNLNWWTFPDMHTRGGPQNAGWLGQVHRGTPWQTLYLKAKREPGSVKVLSISDTSGEVTTVGAHYLSNGDTVSFTGTLPTEWSNISMLSEVTGPIKWTAPNRFMIMGADLDGDGNPDSELSDYGGGNAGLYEPPDLYLNTQVWERWAGSSDTRPVNDRRLIEALTVTQDGTTKGRFSINNPSRVVWSGLFHGLSLPKRQILGPTGGPIPPFYRIIGANIPDSVWNPPAMAGDRDNTLNAINNSKWDNLVGKINALRSTQTPLPVFSRASDILGVEELTDKSPYLTEIITGIATPNDYTTTLVGKYWADDLDLERIPQQLMSLLKAGGSQFYQTYIFTEQLRPARKNNIDGTEKSAVDSNRNVSNYEVAGQSARRVVYELVGAAQWAESYKRGHPGQYRNQNGDLMDLPPSYPRIIQQYPISLDN